MPPQEKDPKDPKPPKPPKAKTENARKDQALDLVLRRIQEARPEFTTGDMEVVWAQEGRGDGDWRALILINGPENTIYSVGYNYESDQLYVDTYRQALVRRFY